MATSRNTGEPLGARTEAGEPRI